MPPRSRLHTLLNPDKPTADIVAIPTLAPDATTTDYAWDTWTHSNGKLWLRDFLQPVLGEVRVSLFEYSASVDAKSGTVDVDRCAADLVDRLTTLRATGRPLLLISHSLGSFVTKRALVLARSGHGGYASRTKRLEGAVALIFFAALHRAHPGREDIGRLAERVDHAVDLSDNHDFAHALRKSHHLLEKINADFVHLLRSEAGQDIEIQSFCEGEPMPEWDSRVLDSYCSTIGIEDFNENAKKLAKDHANICQFSKLHDPDFQRSITHIKDLIDLFGQDKQTSSPKPTPPSSSPPHHPHHPGRHAHFSADDLPAAGSAIERPVPIHANSAQAFSAESGSPRPKPQYRSSDPGITVPLIQVREPTMPTVSETDQNAAVFEKSLTSSPPSESAAQFTSAPSPSKPREPQVARQPSPQLPAQPVAASAPNSPPQPSSTPGFFTPMLGSPAPQSIPAFPAPSPGTASPPPPINVYFTMPENPYAPKPSQPLSRPEDSHHGHGKGYKGNQRSRKYAESDDESSDDDDVSPASQPRRKSKGRGRDSKDASRSPVGRHSKRSSIDEIVEFSPKPSRRHQKKPVYSSDDDDDLADSPKRRPRRSRYSDDDDSEDDLKGKSSHRRRKDDDSRSGKHHKPSRRHGKAGNSDDEDEIDRDRSRRYRHSKHRHDDDDSEDSEEDNRRRKPDSKRRHRADYDGDSDDDDRDRHGKRPSSRKARDGDDDDGAAAVSTSKSRRRTGDKDDKDKDKEDKDKKKKPGAGGAAGKGDGDGGGAGDDDSRPSWAKRLDDVEGLVETGVRIMGITGNLHNLYQGAKGASAFIRTARGSKSGGGGSTPPRASSSSKPSVGAGRKSRDHSPMPAAGSRVSALAPPHAPVERGRRYSTGGAAMAGGSRPSPKRTADRDRYYPPSSSRSRPTSGDYSHLSSALRSGSVPRSRTPGVERGSARH